MNTRKRLLGAVAIVGVAFIFGAQSEALARTGRSVVNESGAKSYCGKEWDGSGCAVCYDQGCGVVTCGQRKDGKCTIDHIDYHSAIRKKPVSKPGARGVTTQPAPVATSNGNTVLSRTGVAPGHRR